MTPFFAGFCPELVTPTCFGANLLNATSESSTSLCPSLQLSMTTPVLDTVAQVSYEQLDPRAECFWLQGTEGGHVVLGANETDRSSPRLQECPGGSKRTVTTHIREPSEGHGEPRLRSLRWSTWGKGHLGWVGKMGKDSQAKAGYGHLSGRGSSSRAGKPRGTEVI